MNEYDKMIEEIKKYEPVNLIEKSDYNSFIEFINVFKEKAFFRSNLIGHISSSCIVVNQKHDKILLAYHLIYDSYAWLGGHADGMFDLKEVAKKELIEETGLKKFKELYNGIASIEVLNVDRHIKNGVNVSSHLHFNVSYLFEGDDNYPLVINEKENSDVKWFRIEDIDNVIEEKNMILIYKKILERL